MLNIIGTIDKPTKVKIVNEGKISRVSNREKFLLQGIKSSHPLKINFLQVFVFITWLLCSKLSIY